MFTDPTLLCPDLSSGDSALANLYRNESGKPLTGVYRSAGAVVGERHELTISHVASSENKSVPSYRHLVRLDHVLPDSDGVPVKASAYLVIVEPQGTITPTNVDDLVLRLLGLFLTEDADPLWSDTTTDMTVLKNNVTSAIAGLRSLRS